MKKEFLECIPYAFTDGTDERDIRQDIAKNPKSFLEKKLRDEGRFAFGTQNIMEWGVYKEMGFAYDLRALLKKFVYKQYNSWHEAYALNRTNLRELVGGRIIKILEVK